MTFFDDCVEQSGDRLLTKWAHYFEVYDRELSHLRDKPVRFLEIGVFKGGSLPMWKRFFPNAASRVFIDIDPACAALEIEGTTVLIGDQADPTFLAALAVAQGPFDVILDDGSHLCQHQIASFEGLWPHLNDRGLYLVEDCHTSYWPGFGGGYRNEASFVEYAKRVVDRMHSWYTDQDRLFPFDPIAKALHSVRFYDSIVVFEKQANKPRPETLKIQSGTVERSSKPLELRNRKSVFRGRDGG